MATKGAHATAVEANPTYAGDSYYEPGTTNKNFNGPVELGERSHSDDSANPVAVEHGLTALESKKTRFFAYLRTREFWIVLAIGYAQPSL